MDIRCANIGTQDDLGNQISAGFKTVGGVQTEKTKWFTLFDALSHPLGPCRRNHSKCLVHCKMGVSRSASTVIAYAMKEFGWPLEKAYNYVKQRRSIARPNAGFMRQLSEYEGILDAR